jgi:hypothetical protein
MARLSDLGSPSVSTESPERFSTVRFRRANLEPVATKPKAKPKAPKAPEPKARAGRPSEAQAEVQRCWEDYWARRSELEAAVALVKDAHRALEDARKGEDELRQRFDEAKLALKQLLDVEPAPDADVSSSHSPEKFN